MVTWHNKLLLFLKKCPRNQIMLSKQLAANFYLIIKGKNKLELAVRCSTVLTLPVTIY